MIIYDSLDFKLGFSLVSVWVSVRWDGRRDAWNLGIWMSGLVSSGGGREESERTNGWGYRRSMRYEVTEIAIVFCFQVMCCDESVSR